MLAFGLSPTKVVRAQAPEGEADALFAEGRRLMVRGDYQRACPKFAEAERLRHGVGTLLNLADCYERLGKTASASRVFLQAAAAAEAASDARGEIARDRARSLESRLLRLTIDTSRVASVEGLEISRDGAVVERGQWNAPVVLDPGRYLIEVRAPGRETFSQSVLLGNESVVIEIPGFAETTKPASTSTPERPQTAPVVPVVPDSKPAPAAASPDGISTQQKIALGVGGVGVAGLVLGGVFGVLSLSSQGEAEKQCRLGPARDQCDDAGWEANEAAIAQGNVATAGFAIGGAALGVATVLWLTGGQTASKESASGLRLLPAITPAALGMAVAGELP